MATTVPAVRLSEAEIVLEKASLGESLAGVHAEGLQAGGSGGHIGAIGSGDARGPSGDEQHDGQDRSERESRNDREWPLRAGRCGLGRIRLGRISLGRFGFVLTGRWRTCRRRATRAITSVGRTASIAGPEPERGGLRDHHCHADRQARGQVRQQFATGNDQDECELQVGGR
jgi:hypothetical protein